ncbi:MAG: methyltransferase domain-containing protein [Nanoarchaeota archaeon]
MSRSAFDIPGYSLLYEQAAHDLQNYRRIAAKTINLLRIPSSPTILDLGCGTGISTEEIIHTYPDARVFGIDSTNPFLELARYKFGKPYTDPLLSDIAKNTPLPSILRERCNIKNLDSYLTATKKILEPRSSQVQFIQADAASLTDVLSEQVDAVVANQVLHWFRKKNEGGNAGPNLAYEQAVLQAVWTTLKDYGSFGFNLSGWDYQFDNSQMNQEHVSKHPFYLYFLESLEKRFGEVSQAQEKAFNDKEVFRVMKENNFSIQSRETQKLHYSPEGILEVCLVGGYMQIFQKAGIELPASEQDMILEEAVRYAFAHSSPDQGHVQENLMHYVARKE